METSLGVCGAIPAGWSLGRGDSAGPCGMGWLGRSDAPELSSPLQPPKWAIRGPNWNNAAPNWGTEQLKLERCGLVGKELMDISGLLDTQPDNTQDCELCRNTNIKEAEGGNAAQATSPERNYTEAGKEEQDWDQRPTGAAGGMGDALSLAAVR